MQPVDLYADSPERMLGLSILCLVALTLLVLWNKLGKSPRQTPARTPSIQPSIQPHFDPPVERHA